MIPVGALVEGPQDQRRLVGADPHQHRGTPCSAASGDVLPRARPTSAGPCSQSISTKSKPLTAAISTSSSAGIRSRTPSSCSPARARAFSDGIRRPSRPTGRCRRRTVRAWRAWRPRRRPPRSSVTIRPRAARETKARIGALVACVPVRSASSRKLRSIRGPSTGPGDRLLTFTPAGPTSKASVEVSPMTAILDAQYGVRRVSGRLPETEARLITSPRPARDHGRQERLADQEDAAHVDVEHLVPARRPRSR